VLKAQENNKGYIREKDALHTLKSEIPELSADNLSIIINSLKDIIQPSTSNPFKQLNTSEIMSYLNKILS